MDTDGLILFLFSLGYPIFMHISTSLVRCRDLINRNKKWCSLARGASGYCREKWQSSLSSQLKNMTDNHMKELNPVVELLQDGNVQITH